jgi:glycosyl transferase family 87
MEETMRSILTPARLASALGVLVLVVWTGFWTMSLRENRMLATEKTWIPAHEFLGLDFQSNWFAVRHWLRGGDPYASPFDDPLGRPLVNPPLVLPLFAWTALFRVRWATALWFVALTGLAVLAAWAVGGVRRDLRLEAIPLPVRVAALLCSMPVMFALERGNWDLLLIPPLCGLAWGLRERSPRRDAVAGLCLTLMAWIKIYPVLLLVAPLALRRWRVVGVFAALSLALAVACWPQLQAIASSIRAVEGDIRTDFCHVYHSWSQAWQPFWQETPLSFLTVVPGRFGAVAVMLPIVAVVSWKIARMPDPGRTMLPYLCWLTACATCLPQVMNDYNWVTLPLLLLMTWSRRDSFVVHMLLAFGLLWMQPFYVAVGPWLFFAFKLAAFFAATWSLTARIEECSEAALSTSVRLAA